jgi:hypothetical protein
MMIDHVLVSLLHTRPHPLLGHYISLRIPLVYTLILHLYLHLSRYRY